MRADRIGRRAAWVAGLLLAALAQVASAAEDRNVVDLAADLAAALEWDVVSSTAIIVKDGDRLSFSVDSPWLMLNYRTRYPMAPAVRRAGGVFVPEKSVARIKEVLETRAARRWRIGVVMIDPGHGGIDPGTLSTHGSKGSAFTVREKDVVLAVSLALERKLRGALPGKRIMLTRGDDRTVSLEERTEMANAVELGRNEAMIYVSVHANGGFNSKAMGFELWIYPPQERRALLDPSSLSRDLESLWPILNSMREDEFNTQSAALASSILAELDREVGGATQNRGIKQESWAVVREALMPAALIELGFVSNAEEARRLADPAYQQKLADGISRGIAGFVQKFEAAMSFLD